MTVKAVRNGNVVELDVREILEAKEDPFNVIMETADTLNDDDTFILFATFKPLPLINVFKGKGYSEEVEQLGEKHWKITFKK